ncbi:glutathione peroxidase [Colwellia polaris]|jgi:glutathione peroxidase|uniref:glutathione peroxidase n=1 Tax=Colwellia polaris TaxID=326537 RepID=UPI000A1713BC|nr:glutathione peroxidase [Colwellia polaris]|tara:strand:- start:4331 stop:4813 length:483 start_codon:yes stop_codon:yes gene_type:complete
MTKTIYTFGANNYKNEAVDFTQYKGKTLLIVNTASACGFTPQYAGLEDLYKKYKDKGLEVLAFPCNQFGKQEKGDNTEIKQFCDLNFNISFDLFSKIDVNGDNTHPLFEHLKNEAPGILGSKGIKWNFTKFLVNNQGKVIKRYSPRTKPADIDSDIAAIL